jgi:lysophospholipase L1-like esterase
MCPNFYLLSALNHRMKTISLFFLLFFGLQATAQTNDQIKVACIGASITYGHAIPEREKNSYPAQLQTLLGKNYEVTNYGVSGTTLLRNGDYPYWKTQQYQQALASLPNIVLIDLGGNDSKLINRIHLNEFERDYREFIQSFARLPSHPRIVLLLPIPSFVTDTTGIWNPVILNGVIPSIKQVAYDNKVEVIDLYSLFVDKARLIPDKIHPNAEGATIMATRLYDLLRQQRDTTYDIFAKISFPQKISSFHGYACTDFQFDGRDCKIVKPKWTAPNHPWVWSARFWGYEPNTDIELLERGFHIVYCDVVELFGNKESIRLWNDFYGLLKKNGLSKKAVLEGMSRGGVYVYNWAAVNPGKVACIYADNPVLDLKSWPGSERTKDSADRTDWEVFKKDYGYTSDKDAMTFSGSPINKVEQIVKGKYRMLHICGDADEEVPMIENTIPFEQKVKALGGDITVIHKPGVKHHPHSLPNPTPIVNFIIKSVE